MLIKTIFYKKYNRYNLNILFEPVKSTDFVNTSSVKVVHKKERAKYAKKELKDFTHKALQHFILEAEILPQLHHLCIVKVYGLNLGDKTHAPSMILELEPTSL